MKSDFSHPHGYERSDADLRLIAALTAGVAVFLLATPYLLSWAYPAAVHAGGIPQSLPKPPMPRLQTQPRADLDRLRMSERNRLGGYVWTDRDHSAIHIPIDRAMELLAARGLSGWPAPAPPAPPQR